MNLSLESFSRAIAQQGTVVTVGNFDGCHLGHRQLVARTVEEAKIQNLRPVALSFSPHPEIFFNRLKAGDRLFTDEQKIRAFGELGVSEVVIETFDEAFAAQSAEWFLETALIKSLGARVVVVGGNFRFGAGRRGDVVFMVDFLRSRGVQVIVCDLSDEDAEVISSSRIRRLLSEGEVQGAAKKLGYRYSLEGIVVEGRKLGRTISFPTANAGQIEQMMPKSGVYAVSVDVGKDLFQQSDLLNPLPLPLRGVCNIGVRPTVSDSGVISVEVHVFDRSSRYGQLPVEWYGLPIRIKFERRIRAEQKFSSLDALRTQIALDIEEAKKN